MTRKSAPSYPSWLRCGADCVTIEVLARPGSPRRGILRIEPRGVVIGVASPAEKGKANDELAAVIAQIVGVPRTAVSIIRGASARAKVVRVAAATPTVVAERIAALAVESTERQT
jgi:uncharacterized protein (TIGR00251 family)